MAQYLCQHTVDLIPRVPCPLPRQGDCLIGAHRADHEGKWPKPWASSGLVWLCGCDETSSPRREKCSDEQLLDGQLERLDLGLKLGVLVNDHGARNDRAGDTAGTAEGWSNEGPPSQETTNKNGRERCDDGKEDRDGARFAWSLGAWS